MISIQVLLGFSVSQIDIPVYSDLLNQAQRGDKTCCSYNPECIYTQHNDMFYSSFRLANEEEKDALISTVSGIADFSMSFG